MRNRLDLLETSWGCGVSVFFISGSSDGRKEWGRCSSLTAGACSCGFKLANEASLGWRDKEGRKGPRAAAGWWVRLEKEVSGHRQDSVDVAEDRDGHSGDSPVPRTMARLSFPPAAIPDGHRVGSRHWRKWAGTTSFSGFKRKSLAASPFSHPLLPSSLDGGSQLQPWWVPGSASHGASSLWMVCLEGMFLP